MTKTQEKTVETVEEKTTVDAKPSEKDVKIENPIEGKEVDKTTPAEVSTETKEKADLATDNERTRIQFEKLLESNKKLYEANTLLRQEMQNRQMASKQFETIQQPPVQEVSAQPQSRMEGVKPEDFIEVDPVSGEKFVNETKLQAKIEELSGKATRAEQAIQQYIKTSEQREVDRQNRIAFAAYPELDPSSPDFNVGLHNQTRAVIYDSLINPQDYGGKSLDFKDAADFVKKQFAQTSSEKTGGKTDENQDSAKDSAKAKAEAEAAQDLKKQASASIAGEQPGNRPLPPESEDSARLRMATRQGSVEALAQRLMNTPHAGTPTSGKGSEEAS